MPLPENKMVMRYVAKYPTCATLTLARKIYADHPLLFPTLEAARSAIRYVRVKAKRKHPKSATATAVLVDPNKIPVSHAEAKPPHIVPSRCNRVLIISDLHIPYHVPKAVEIALNYGLENKANCILINGDLIDFHHLSKFEKDIEKRNTKQEFDAAYEFLAYLRKLFPRAYIVWAEGNHDARYPRFLAAKVRELFDDEYYTLQSRLKLDKLRIEFVPDTRYIKIGKLTVSHGHKIIRGIFAPVNAARGVFLRTKSSHLIGHTHSVSEHSEKRLEGELITTWSIGCLCELNPDYDPFVSKSAHGFAFVNVLPNGHYRVINKRIVDGELL
jgi:predicted phosphodiesterase